MKRIVIVLTLGLAVAVACSDNAGPSPALSLSPVLDSIFIGDVHPAFTVHYTDPAGNPLDPGVVRWSTSTSTLLQVDSVTGIVTGLAAGFGQVQASARGITAAALVVVSKALSITLLLDTIYLMPSDTLSVPVSVAHQAAGTPTVWFRAAQNAVFDIDSATGLSSGKTAGGPLPFVAFAALGTDTAADSGTVEIVSLTDTTGGQAGYTLFGTVIRSAKSAVEAVNYPRDGGTLTFRLRAFISQGGTTAEAVVITLLTNVTTAGAFAIDSISPFEALGIGNLDPICRPPRNWGTWSTIATNPEIQAASRQGGTITITKVVSIANGLAIGGRFGFTAQRLDLYGDPLGALPVRGTFVAPLVPASSRCVP
jgi:hypothetical protein